MVRLCDHFFALQSQNSYARNSILRNSNNIAAAGIGAVDGTSLVLIAQALWRPTEGIAFGQTSIRAEPNALIVAFRLIITIDKVIPIAFTPA